MLHNKSQYVTDRATDLCNAGRNMAEDNKFRRNSFLYKKWLKNYKKKLWVENSQPRNS